MSKLEKTIAKLQGELQQAEGDWQTRKGELDQQVNREYGFYVGKVESIKKTIALLTAPDEDEVEKKESELEPTGEEV